MIETTHNVNRYDGDDETTEFDYTYKILSNSHLRVYVDDELLVLGTDYEVSGVGNSEGGTVTFDEAPASGDSNVVIERLVPITHITSYPEGSKFPTRSVEQDFDKRTMVEQQLQNYQDRTITLSVTAADGNESLQITSNASERGGKILAFSENGYNIVTTLDANGAVEALSDIANAANAAINSVEVAASDATNAAEADISNATNAAINAAEAAISGLVQDAENAASNAANSEAAIQPLADMLAGATKGDLLVANEDGDMTYKSVGGDGHILVANSAHWDGITWEEPTVDLLTATNTGDVLVGNSGGTMVRIPVGNDGDVLRANSANSTYGLEWVRMSGGLPGVFAPDLIIDAPSAEDLIWNKVAMTRCSSLVTEGGLLVKPRQTLTCVMNSTGAGGTIATAVNNRLYELWYIFKDGIDDPLAPTEDALIARQYEVLLNAATNQPAAVSTQVLRANSDATQLAQGFQTTTNGTAYLLDCGLSRSGNPSGSIWMEVQGDSGGFPSGTALAVTETHHAALVPTTETQIRLPLLAPLALVQGTQYHLVLKGDYGVSATDNISWITANGYASGNAARLTGVGWADQNTDFKFTVLQVHNADSQAFSYPTDYNDRCLLGYFALNSSGNIIHQTQFNRTVSFMPITAAARISSDVATTRALHNYSTTMPAMRPVSAWFQLGGGTAGKVVSIGSLKSTDLIATHNSTHRHAVSIATGGNDAGSQGVTSRLRVQHGFIRTIAAQTGNQLSYGGYEF